MSLTFGALFAGYGGLEMGVQTVLGGATLWHSELEPDPSKILAAHWPDVPNLGDVTKVDWASVSRVDVLTGGFPWPGRVSRWETPGAATWHQVWAVVAHGVRRSSKRWATGSCPSRSQRPPACGLPTLRVSVSRDRP
jgi:hypothetical protein